MSSVRYTGKDGECAEGEGTGTGFRTSGTLRDVILCDRQINR